jgi:hypothetical protein
LVVANTGVLVPNVEGSLESSVSVDNKAVSLIHEHLKINEDLAEELYKHWISVKIRTSISLQNFSIDFSELETFFITL